MSAVCIIAPVVVAAWPAFSSAVVAAAASLGYQVAASATEEVRVMRSEAPISVNLEIPNSEVVTGQIGRDQRIRVTKDGVTVTFSRDARGRAAVCVTGQADQETLQAMGNELSQAVVQQYVYQRLMDEMRTRGFLVVQEENEQDRTIHLKVRHWES